MVPFIKETDSTAAIDQSPERSLELPQHQPLIDSLDDDSSLNEHCKQIDEQEEKRKKWRKTKKSPKNKATDSVGDEVVEIKLRERLMSV